MEQAREESQQRELEPNLDVKNKDFSERVALRRLKQRLELINRKLGGIQPDKDLEKIDVDFAITEANIEATKDKFGDPHANKQNVKKELLNLRSELSDLGKRKTEIIDSLLPKDLLADREKIIKEINRIEKHQ